MKKILALVLLLSGHINALSQTESFDIASFTVPRGWQRSDSNGVILLQDYHEANGKTSFCQIIIFPSRASNKTAINNFNDEWNERVVKPTGTKTKPQTQTEKTPDGWVAVTGISNIAYQGISYACMFVTVSGFGRVMSMRINLAGEDYPAQVESFLKTFELDGKAAVAMSNADNKPGGSGNFTFNNYSFIAPEGWQTRQAKDQIMLLQSQTNEPGCVITILPPQPSSGDLEKDARNVFDLMYPGWQFRFAGEKQYDLSKGYTVQGLEYCMMEAPMSKLSTDGSRYVGFEDGAAWIIKTGSQIVIIAARHTSLLAHVDCLNKYETWRRFFNSFTVKNVAASKNSEEESSKRIVGVWTLITSGTASGEYVFAANGNYRLIGAIGTSSTSRDYNYEYLHIKSYAFQGDGSYLIEGRQLKFRKLGKNPEQVQFRFDKVNHGGTGWKDRLYMLKTDPGPAGTYEVWYEKKNPLDHQPRLKK